MKLGWIFDDPNNPQDSDIQVGWDRYVGGEPTPPDWDYDAARLEPWGNNPGQWYIQVPNLINNNPTKHFWLSYVYERDNTYQGPRAFTNMSWFPFFTYETIDVYEEMFDINGDPTGNPFEAAYGRMTIIYDMSPNPQYEEIYIGVTGSPAGSFHLVEAYVITQCVPCVVDMDDLLFFLNDWLETGTELEADFVGEDNRVDLLDFSYLAGYWMSNCPENWPW